MPIHPDEKPFTLADMCCPCCKGTDMSVQRIYLHFPTVAFDTRPLELIDCDGGRDDHGWVTLIVHCAGCDREMDLYCAMAKPRSMTTPTPPAPSGET
jgi:hypothetical protein